MIKVKDERGNEISGMYKDVTGALIVHNDEEYRRYVREKKQTETITKLTKEVSELQTMVLKLTQTILEIKRSINKQV